MHSLKLQEEMQYENRMNLLQIRMQEELLRPQRSWYIKRPSPEAYHFLIRLMPG